MRCRRLWAVLGLALGVAAPARADDLVVLSAAAVKTAVAGLPAALAEGGRDRVTFVFGTAGAVRDKAAAGTPFDLAILPPATLAEMARRDLVVPGAGVPLGIVRLGAAGPADGPAPAVATVDELKAALRAAPSIGMADPALGATSGRYLDALFGTLGLADVVRPKLKLFPEGQAAMEAVARHEVALGLGQISEAAPVPGLALTPLPAEAQLETTYAGALATHSAHPEAARRLLDMLRAFPSRAAFKAAGFDLPP